MIVSKDNDTVKLEVENQKNASAPDVSPFVWATSFRSFDFFHWFHATVLPTVFFIGMLIAFVSCSISGYFLKDINIFRHFHRFHMGIEPVSNFYPTFSELKQIVLAKAQKDKTLVVIGGNSVLNGCGQPVEQLWSDRLQELLGNRFTVINLAFRGAEPFDVGYYVAEGLRKEFPNLIYLTISNPGQIVKPFGSATYRYAYYQALYSGSLISDLNRSKAVSAELSKSLDNDTELQLGAYINNSFYVSELWNAITMRWFSSVWNKLAINPLFGPFCPRKHMVDFSPAMLPVPLRYEVHREVRELELKTLRDIINVPFWKNGHELEPNWEFRNRFRDKAFEAVPAEMRSRVLVLQLPNSPYFTRELNAMELALHLKVYQVGTAMWKANGFHSLQVGQDFTMRDYADRQHLSPSGGFKLAEQVAPELELISRN